ncbi:MAG: pyrophosphate--fructose-6-phosphate 1-phosphotransferase, partial [Aestuariivirga sp.]
MPQHKIAMLTAGGLAPCLSSAVGGLIERYTEIASGAPIIGYRSGYKGLLLGQSIPVTPEVRAGAHILHGHGGTPLGNSRVKLTNVADCVKRGLVKPGDEPLAIAANQLIKDGITILHTIGGDDTNTTAGDLAARLARNDYPLTVVGLPKTVDNDVIPIRQTLGAATAAAQGAVFFENIVNEQSTSSRQLIIHEVMGRNCGWLTAATARAWRERLGELQFLPSFNLSRRHKDIDAIYIPELPIDIAAEARRLRKVMDEKDSVSIFVSEGAGLAEVVQEMEARAERVERDAFGHMRLDTIKVGDWFGKQFAKQIGADKTLVQKSGYFARSAAANATDLALIRSMVDV